MKVPTIRADVFGWHDKPEGPAAHDPGLNAICPVCAKKLEMPVRTVSLMLFKPELRERSYFYRMHLDCAKGLSPEEGEQIEGALIDAEIQRMKKS